MGKKDVQYSNGVKPYDKKKWNYAINMKEPKRWEKKN